MASDIIREALSLGEAFVSRTAQLPVLDEPPPTDVQAHLAERYTFERPIDSSELVADVGHMLEQWAVQTTHPRYFGYFNPTPLEEAIAADLITAFYNPQLAVWSHAPAAVEIERHVLDWVGQKLGLPLGSSLHSRQ